MTNAPIDAIMTNANAKATPLEVESTIHMILSQKPPSISVMWTSDVLKYLASNMKEYLFFMSCHVGDEGSKLRSRMHGHVATYRLSQGHKTPKQQKLQQEIFDAMVEGAQADIAKKFPNAGSIQRAALRAKKRKPAVASDPTLRALEHLESICEIRAPVATQEAGGPALVDKGKKSTPSSIIGDLGRLQNAKAQRVA